MEKLGARLGKLSLKILEHFVGTTLGEGFVDELRKPTDRELAIESALENSDKLWRSIGVDELVERILNPRIEEAKKHLDGS